MTYDEWRASQPPTPRIEIDYDAIDCMTCGDEGIINDGGWEYPCPDCRCEPATFDYDDEPARPLYEAAIGWDDVMPEVR